MISLTRPWANWLADRRGHLSQAGSMPIYLFGAPYLSVPWALKHFNKKQDSDSAHCQICCGIISYGITRWEQASHRGSAITISKIVQSMAISS